MQESLLLLLCILSTTMAAPCTVNGQLECERTVVIDGEHFNMTWSMGEDSITLTMQVSPSTNWAGFGIGEPAAGSMPGADIVVVYKENGKWIAQDSYTDGFVAPIKDTWQDWTLVSVVESKMKKEFTVKRALDTKHNGQDRIIPDKEADLLVPSDFIFARGESTSVTYHGDFRWRQRMHLYKGTEDAVEFTSLADYDSTVIVANNNVSIPQRETTYYEGIFADSTWFSDKLDGRTLIGVSGFASPQSLKYVHHMTIYALRSGDVNGGGEQFYTWTPGVSAMFLPLDVGFNLNGYRGIRIQYHFDNKAKIAGIRDSSGIKIYVTKKNSPRAKAFGLVQFGDPAVKLAPQKLLNGISMYEFTCTNLQVKEKITIISHILHMHKKGVMMETLHYRGDNLLNTAKIEFYDYATQGSLYTNTTALPGDSFVTRCYYKTDGSVQMGLASSQEMCIDFVSYYPRQASLGGYCGLNRGKGEYNGASSITSLPRKFGFAPPTRTSTQTISTTTVTSLDTSIASSNTKATTARDSTLITRDSTITAQGTLKTTSAPPSPTTHELATATTTLKEWDMHSVRFNTIAGSATECYIVLFGGEKCASSGGVYLVSKDWYNDHWGGQTAIVNSCGTIVDNWLTKGGHSIYANMLRTHSDLDTRASFVAKFNDCGTGGKSTTHVMNTTSAMSTIMSTKPISTTKREVVHTTPTQLTTKEMPQKENWTLSDIESNSIGTVCFIAFFSGPKCASSGGVYLVSYNWRTRHPGGQFSIEFKCGKVVDNWLTKGGHNIYASNLQNNNDMDDRAKFIAKFDCEEDKFSTSATTITTTTTKTSTTPNKNKTDAKQVTEGSESNSTQLYVIVGVAIGVVVLVSAIAIAALLIRKKQQSNSSAFGKTIVKNPVYVDVDGTDTHQDV
eukprot:m.340476 g.340476  ORF g.340476 m.340476 type:complete len:901 (-) comp19325_c0_seq1:91-2793(-)